PGPTSPAQNRTLSPVRSPNFDLYRFFVNAMLGIPMELYTPLFAIARVSGWSAHRMEEMSSATKIIRPAYQSLVKGQTYYPRAAR
ncbi:MAG: citrate synthase, partial [Oscillospiraceae bacterium]|nr:citrate synthase [Oscillospiraceae bacterium]